MVDSPTKKREALKSFLAKHHLKPHTVAKKAGITSSALYNFLAEKSDNLSITTLEKIAKATGCTIGEIIGTDVHQPAYSETVDVLYIVGVFGKMYASESGVTTRPIGIPEKDRIVAAIIKGDGLRPLPSGMTVFFNADPTPPAKCIGKLCVVRIPTSDEPMIREVHKGSQPGLYTLIGWSSGAITDTEISACHIIRSMTQPE
jgi:DNA-binding Xre family transcriptional regulator